MTCIISDTVFLTNKYTRKARKQVFYDFYLRAHIHKPQNHVFVFHIKRGFHVIYGTRVPVFKGQLHSKNTLSSNERARKMQENEPSLTSMRQMVLEISHFKVGNLRKMEVAILKVFCPIFT